MDTLNPDYIPLSHLKAYFADTFNMLDDAQKTLDKFLQSGVIESDNRVDEYDDSIGSLKITPFGMHLLNELPHNFSYLDLVCLDCGVHDRGVADSLAGLGNKDRDLFLESKKLERINVRLEKVRYFLDYLAREENIERNVYDLDAQDPRIIPELRAKYDEDENRVQKSANRNYEE